MISKIKEFVILSCLVVMALFFRINNLEGRMTFEWDQARDFDAVETMINTGKPALLGPIVRGETGGFYIGPLYYYLITPLYFFSGGNPVSLMILSIGLDIVVICLLYWFIRSQVGISSATIVAALWAGSPLIVNNALIPWNVSLIPVWTLIYIIVIYRLVVSTRFRYKFVAVFLASLTTNIHLSLVPIALYFLLINWKKFINLPYIQYILLGIAAVIPISTLIIHDLIFRFENTILLKRFLFGVGTKSANISQIIFLIVEKYGYTIGRLFTGEPYTILGLVITVLLVGFGFLYLRKNPIIRYSLLSIAVTLFSLLIYRDSDFAEYYFMPTFIPILILLAYFTHAFLAKISQIFRYLTLIIVCGLYLYLGLLVRSSAISPYSLAVKRMIITAISDLGYSTEFRTNLPRERNTGFGYLMKQMNVVSDSSASRKAYVYEVQNMEVISPPEARSIIFEKPIQAFKLIVFSN